MKLTVNTMQIPIYRTRKAKTRDVRLEDFGILTKQIGSKLEIEKIFSNPNLFSRVWRAAESKLLNDYRTNIEVQHVNTMNNHFDTYINEKLKLDLCSVGKFKLDFNSIQCTPKSNGSLWVQIKTNSPLFVSWRAGLSMVVYQILSQYPQFKIDVKSMQVDKGVDHAMLSFMVEYAFNINRDNGVLCKEFRNRITRKRTEYENEIKEIELKIEFHQVRLRMMKEKLDTIEIDESNKILEFIKSV